MAKNDHLQLQFPSQCQFTPFTDVDIGTGVIENDLTIVYQIQKAKPLSDHLIQPCYLIQLSSIISSFLINLEVFNEKTFVKNFDKRAQMLTAEISALGRSHICPC